MNNENKNKEQLLDDFQIRNIKLLTHLMIHDAVDDEVVENIRKSELDYFALLGKYKLLEEKINVDEKTNLLKYKNDYLTKIIKTASRIYFGAETSTYEICFIRFDIDDFSLFNNKYGHETGDQVLVAIADIIRGNSRPTDYAIRFGGEEFDVILPATTIDGARTFIDKIFQNINETEIDFNGEKLKVTVSAGISHLSYIFKGSKDIQDTIIEGYFKDLQCEADDALYEAKLLGKNRYCIYDSTRQNEYHDIRSEYSS